MINKLLSSSLLMAVPAFLALSTASAAARNEYELLPEPARLRLKLLEEKAEVLPCESPCGWTEQARAVASQYRRTGINEPLEIEPLPGRSGNQVFRAKRSNETYVFKIMKSYDSFHRELYSNILMGQNHPSWGDSITGLISLCDSGGKTIHGLAFHDLGDKSLSAYIKNWHQGETHNVFADAVKNIGRLHQGRIAGHQQKAAILLDAHRLTKKVANAAKDFDITAIDPDKLSRFSVRLLNFLETNDIWVGFTHGDLHFDNIVIDDSNHVRFVDNGLYIRSVNSDGHPLGLIDEELYFFSDFHPSFDIFGPLLSKGRYTGWSSAPEFANFISSLIEKYYPNKPNYMDSSARSYFAFLSNARILGRVYTKELHDLSFDSIDELWTLRRRLLIDFCIHNIRNIIH